MKPFLGAPVIYAALALLPAVALAQGYAPPGSDADSPYPSAPQGFEEQYPAAPADALGQSAPPEPSTPPPPAASTSPSPAGPAGVPPGQWVWTGQYGWIWMPYADSYTSVPADDYGSPYMYVYCPSFGWSWLLAPWVWGLGPWPSFGILGPLHFGWYHHGWWRTPERWHWTARTSFQGGFRGGFPASRAPFSRGTPPGRPVPGFHAGGRAGGAAFGAGGSAFRGGDSGYRGGFSGRSGFSGHGTPELRSGRPGPGGGSGGRSWGSGGSHGGFGGGRSHGLGGGGHSWGRH
ncbi:MAG TPA: hypothetical protein VFG59_05025 [Anaeromyxobacter sp.]|nr:hypothetical protein [Anaeromyxobacter sp.]